MGQNQQVRITLLCPLLGISRQSFYAFFRQQTQHAFEAEIVLAEVLRIRALLPRLETRKLLQQDAALCGLTRVPLIQLLFEKPKKE